MLLFAAPAWSQVAVAADSEISTAFSFLRAQSGIHLCLLGTNQTGLQSVLTRVDVYWESRIVNDQPVARLELIEQEQRYGSGMKITNRIVGDGTTLYQYDPAAHQYTAIQYGTINGPQPEGYTDNLLELFTSAPTRNGSYAQRMLREIVSSSASRYASWLPGAVPVRTTNAVYYAIGNPVQRSLTFSLNPDTGEFQSATYFNSRRVGYQTLVTSWTITSDSDFASYVPFAPWARTSLVGWRALPWSGLTRLRTSGG